MSVLTGATQFCSLGKGHGGTGRWGSGAGTDARSCRVCKCSRCGAACGETRRAEAGETGHGTSDRNRQEPQPGGAGDGKTPREMSRGRGRSADSRGGRYRILPAPRGGAAGTEGHPWPRLTSPRPGPFPGAATGPPAGERGTKTPEGAGAPWPSPHRPRQRRGRARPRWGQGPRQRQRLTGGRRRRHVTSPALRPLAAAGAVTGGSPELLRNAEVPQNASPSQAVRYLNFTIALQKNHPPLGCQSPFLLHAEGLFDNFRWN